MLWDPKDRRYEDDNGRPVSPAKVRKLINEYIQSEQEGVRRESDKLFDDTITVAQFFAYMREKITSWHSVAGVIAYGGEDEMNGERWARINQKILSELQYLNGFEQQAEESFMAIDEIAEQVAETALKELDQWQPTAIN